jgi:uncharacterized membrane protein (UPF0127 family)
MSINGKKFEALIADSSTKRIIGLMYRKSIAAKQCMLFIFESEGRHAIWMQNMQFAIDVIWLDSKYKIIDIKENLQPCSSIFNCPEYAPKKEAKYIIELNQGAVRRNAIKMASPVKILK